MNKFIQSLFLLMILITQYVKSSTTNPLKTQTEETIKIEVKLFKESFNELPEGEKSMTIRELIKKQPDSKKFRKFNPTAFKPFYNYTTTELFNNLLEIGNNYSFNEDYDNVISNLDKLI